MFELNTIKVKVHGQEYNYKVLSHPGAAAILPIRGNEVLLVEQYRPAAGKRLLEIPAGTLEPGEDPLECAYRELEEETGFRAQSLKSLGSFFPAPGYSREVLHLFLAEELKEGRQHLDDSEDIEVSWIPLSRAYEMVESGELVDGKTIITLLRYRAGFYR